LAGDNLLVGSGNIVILDVTTDLLEIFRTINTYKVLIKLTEMLIERECGVVVMLNRNLKKRTLG